MPSRHSAVLLTSYPSGRSPLGFARRYELERLICPPEQPPSIGPPCRSGTSLRDRTLLPTERQTHLALEPAFGLTPNLAVGFMFLNAGTEELGFVPARRLISPVCIEDGSARKKSRIASWQRPVILCQSLQCEDVCISKKPGASAAANVRVTGNCWRWCFWDYQRRQLPPSL